MDGPYPLYVIFCIVCVGEIEIWPQGITMTNLDFRVELLWEVGDGILEILAIYPDWPSPDELYTDVDKVSMDDVIDKKARLMWVPHSANAAIDVPVGWYRDSSLRFASSTKIQLLKGIKNVSGS